MKVRTRMAPSPTGEIHIGGLRTALYDYAWARKNKGKFVLRIEDTDRERLVEGALDQIRDDFVDYGILWDEGPEPVGGPFGPYIQSERLEIYKKYAMDLIASGHAYNCFCTKERLEEVRKKQMEEKRLPGYDRHCRNLTTEEVNQKLSQNIPSVIRMKIPDGEQVVFEDMARGEIRTNSITLDDQVILKSDGFPTYHLAVVVDDHLMEITHIIRGNEWLPSTPKHVLLFQFFGWEIPKFAHLSIFLDPEGDGKMSKRKGSVSARGFLSDGYLPEAMLNYLMLLGWNPGGEKEIFTLREFAEIFDLKDLNKSNQKFTFEKLNWFNQHYIRSLDEKELIARLKPFTTRSEQEISKVLPLVKERMITLKDFDSLTEYFFDSPKIDQTLLAKYPDTKRVLDNTISTLEEDFDGKILEENARAFCQTNDVKVGDYFMILRLATTGRAQTPPLWDVMQILGKDETLERLKHAQAPYQT